MARSERRQASSAGGKVVHVKMTAIRSHFAPDNIEGVQVGDTVLFHVTNIEQDWDVPHGFAAIGSASDSELLIMPGETRTLTWVPKQPGVYPFYCTDFCSALHQEMQGYVRVSPSAAATPINGPWDSGKVAQRQSRCRRSQAPRGGPRSPVPVAARDRYARSLEEPCHALHPRPHSCSPSPRCCSRRVVPARSGG